MLSAVILTLTLVTPTAVSAPCPPAKSVVIGTRGRVSLSGSAQVLDDPTHAMNLSEAMKAGACAGFKPVTTANLGVRSRHWLRFSLDFSGSTQQAWLVAFKSSSYARACIHWPMADGTYRSECAGSTSSVVVRHDRTLFTMPTGTGPRGVVYAELESWQPAPVDFELIRDDVFVSEEQSRQFLSGLFNGILLLTVIYNVLFYFAMKDRASLLYSIHLAALGLAMLGFDGYGGQFIWPWLGAWGSHVPAMLLGVTFIFGNQYGRDFLDTRNRAPRMDIVLRIAAAISAIVIVVAFFDIDIAERLGALSGLAFSLSLGSAAALLALRGDRSATYLLFGISPAFLAGVIVVGLRVLGVTAIPPGFGASLTKAGLVIGAMTLSVGLNRRMTALRHERDRAFSEAAAQQQIALHRAYFDEITQLPNRSRFMAAGTELLGSALNEGRSLMVIAVDVVGFRDVNRAFGASADAVLAELGTRLRSVAENGALVARIAGNEFVFAQRAAADSGAAEAEGRRVGENVSAGVASADGRGRPHSETCSHAWDRPGAA